jgi:hypothetical protein
MLAACLNYADMHVVPSGFVRPSFQTLRRDAGALLVRLLRAVKQNTICTHYAINALAMLAKLTLVQAQVHNLPPGYPNTASLFHAEGIIPVRSSSQTCTGRPCYVEVQQHIVTKHSACCVR